MNSVKKVGIVIFGCLQLVACRSQLNKPNLKKEGTEYKIGDTVHFYYPNQYELDDQNTNNNRIYFRNGDQHVFYEMIADKTDNLESDLDELYVGQLEESGATDIAITRPVVDSGLPVFEITGKFDERDRKFKYIVYFNEGTTYIYGYQATKEEYDEHIESMITFLHSIVVEEEIDE